MRRPASICNPSRSAASDSASPAEVCSTACDVRGARPGRPHVRKGNNHADQAAMQREQEEAGMFKKLSLALAVSLLTSASSYAACAYKNERPVKGYFAAFPAWKILAAAMAECGNFQAELDQEIRTKGAPAFAARPSLYHMGYVHNGTIVPHLNQNSIRP